MIRYFFISTIFMIVSNAQAWEPTTPTFESKPPRSLDQMDADLKAIQKYQDDGYEKWAEARERLRNAQADVDANERYSARKPAELEIYVDEIIPFLNQMTLPPDCDFKMEDLGPGIRIHIASLRSNYTRGASAILSTANLSYSESSRTYELRGNGIQMQISEDKKIYWISISEPVSRSHDYASSVCGIYRNFREQSVQ